ncbi:MAG: hypothetical protein GF411_05495 [Candidatus Lokiarchaeota archaeon]|nr:hypothetical protein [Candidatus Lokiarchaeota archaeon]
MSMNYHLKNFRLYVPIPSKSCCELKYAVRCPVYSTESVEVIKSSIEVIFFPLSFEITEIMGTRYLIYTSNDQETLELLRDLIHNLRIIDTVRKRLEQNWNGTSTFFKFDKQAITVGRFRILDDSAEDPPLGSILVELFFEEMNRFEIFLKWFTPPTKGGRIVQN